MERTPKGQKRKSLSLGRRLSNKRHSVSPKDNLRTVDANSELSRNAFVTSISIDCGVECTPPHKKLNLDDSVDYSPKYPDSSYSPTGYFSQTLAANSPEVGWRWSSINKSKEAISTVTPDSAYSGDNSFTSSEVESAEAKANRNRNEIRRKEQRKAMQFEIRRAERNRADEMLRQRCARLQEQLKEPLLDKEEKQHLKNVEVDSKKNVFFASEDVSEKILKNTNEVPPKSVSSAKKPETVPSLPKTANETFTDFFNDSESDCLLLEATQKLELEIVELTQKTPPEVTATVSGTNLPTTPTSSNKKRSSFYMKFLEDDSPDDWFVSLDDVIAQATQTKKPLQRYNSMPTESITTNMAKSTVAQNPSKTTNSNSSTTKFMNSTAASGKNTLKMKRHLSSNAFT